MLTFLNNYVFNTKLKMAFFFLLDCILYLEVHTFQETRFVSGKS